MSSATGPRRSEGSYSNPGLQAVNASCGSLLMSKKLLRPRFEREHNQEGIQIRTIGNSNANEVFSLNAKNKELSFGQ